LNLPASVSPAPVLKQRVLVRTTISIPQRPLGIAKARALYVANRRNAWFLRQPEVTGAFAKHDIGHGVQSGVALS
jgi:hypothetical protein